jgi:peptide deformylase
VNTLPGRRRKISSRANSFAESSSSVVPRHARLHYRGLDAAGNLIERDVDGFHARVVQHECDHLNGILYPMRVRDFSRFGFTDVLFPGLAESAD